MTNNGNKTFIYNAENMLIEVKDSANQTIATFTYDHEGKRTSMTTASGTTYFHYSGDKVVYETDASNNITAEYTYDPLGNPATMTKNGVTYYYHVNGHGDVVALTDGSGNIVAQYSYDAWGNILSQSGTMASANPLRYAGYRYDEVTGLYYLMARYYDPSIGRFITRDTFHGFEDDPLSLNQYAYTKNNPVMFIDPDGHFAWMLVGAASGGIIAYLIYLLEVKLGMRKWNTTHMLAIVAASAALGAINGGLSGIGKLGGIINKAVKLGYFTKKEANKYKMFLTVKKMILMSTIKIPTKNGSESWWSYSKKLVSKIKYYLK